MNIFDRRLIDNGLLNKIYSKGKEIHHVQYFYKAYYLWIPKRDQKNLIDGVIYGKFGMNGFTIINYLS
ncbi:MAG: hypothetical protein Ct9H90mP3_8400 [Flammeovirgaceae bacterium]|nr:MAG: hypothetical protein Ct9H90mP3_8400 [Flammeovirgaceae bacterium]